MIYIFVNIISAYHFCFTIYWPLKQNIYAVTSSIVFNTEYAQFCPKAFV